MDLQNLKKPRKYFRIIGVLSLLTFIVISIVNESYNYKNYFLYLSVFCFLLPFTISVFLYLLKDYFK